MSLKAFGALFALDIVDSFLPQLIEFEAKYEHPKDGKFQFTELSFRILKKKWTKKIHKKE
jgi:hypothetical protein